MRKNSVKNTRINGEIRRVMAEVIRGEIKDPRIDPWTSVVAVEVAPDLKSCKAWISVLGSQEARDATLEGLRSAEGFIRSRLAKTVNLRNTPEIIVCMDQSIVDVSGIPNVRSGIDAVIIGRSGKEEITAAQIAEQCGTITHEILTGLAERLGRVEGPRNQNKH